MTREPSEEHDDAFLARRAQARERIDKLVGAFAEEGPERRNWFQTVYDKAEGDAAAVPWADLAAKPQLVDWLKNHPGDGRAAIDIACGLGDNAEALADAGYRTTAFDYAAGAIDWARRRFPESAVDYCVADLFDLPGAWRGAFDLVHECYTVQAISGERRDAAFAPIAGLVAPGGRLLVIARVRPEGAQMTGPPWPLSPGELARYEALGLRPVSSRDFAVRRSNRMVPHVIAEYMRPV